MTACHRFEREGLLLLERGEPLDEHYESCPDCRRERAAYARLEGALGGGEIASAPEGWQDRVRETIERRSRRRLHGRRWVAGSLAAAAAAALVMILLPGRPSPATLEVSVESGARTVRGPVGAMGDRLEVAATTGGQPRAEIRVYRDDSDLVLRCSSDPPCNRRGRRLVAELDLELRGSYETLLVTSDRAIAVPTNGGLDADIEAILEAGGMVVLAEEIVVR